MPTYQYVNKSGTLSSVDAADANTALSTAKDIGTGSGVMEVKTNSYPVVTSSAAQNDYDKIKSNYNDIKTGMQNQASIITNQNTQKEAQAKADAQQAESNRLEQAKINNAIPQVGTPEYDKYYGLPNGTSSSSTFNPASYGIGDGNAVLGNAQYQKGQLVDEYKATADKAIQTIDSIQNGAIPLSPEQQAQINALRQSFNTMIENQKLTNITDTGVANIRGYQKGSAEYDPTFQTKVIGEVFAGGQRKIAEFNNQMAEAVAKLTLGFKKDNIQAIKEAYTMYQDSYEKRIQAINSLVKDAQDAIKVEQDRQQKAKEEQLKVQSSIDTMIQKATEKTNVPSDVLYKAKASKNLFDAITILSPYMKDVDSTGVQKQYLDYVALAKASGVSNILDGASWYSKYGPGKSIGDANLGGYTPSQEKAIENINSSVSKNSVYAATTDMEKAVNAVKAALSMQNGLSDIAAINQFQKIIDNGAVTRDQDVVLIQSAQSLIGSLKTKINKLQKGEQLGADQRAQMLQLVDSIYDQQKKVLSNDPYVMSQKKAAERNGIDVSDTILGDILGNEANANIIKEQKTAEDRIYDVYSTADDAVRGMIDELQGKGDTTEEIEKILIDYGLLQPKTSVDSLRKAITAQESGGSYTAVNKDSGALGKYQIMPFNLPVLVGLENTPENRKKFINSPKLQDEAFQVLIGDLMNKYDGDIQKVLAAYYGGGEAAKIVGTDAGNKPQGGGKYPSINQYVAEVMSRMNNA